MITSRLSSLAVAPAVAAALLVTTLSGCVTTKEAIAHKENELLAAGFIDHPANTPERQTMLAKLPANKFVRNTKGDSVKYVYADPVSCNCLYVGTQQAYGSYVKTMQAKNLADEQQMTAMDYSDASWNWGAWGPWGGLGWGFGRGYGW